MICFQISIFEPLETTRKGALSIKIRLWFAFKLVSLNHWKQLCCLWHNSILVVICFQISIFEPLETTVFPIRNEVSGLWFAFKLVSLNHWKQLASWNNFIRALLWFAFILVSLNHWKQQSFAPGITGTCCDLLSF